MLKAEKIIRRDILLLEQQKLQIEWQINKLSSVIAEWESVLSLDREVSGFNGEYTKMLSGFNSLD